MWLLCRWKWDNSLQLSAVINFVKAAKEREKIWER